MDIFQALVLGIVQGFTEFLPISSSGHLVFFPQVFGWPEQPLVFDTTLHLATAAALVVYFWRDLVSVAKAFFRDIRSLGLRFKSYSSEGKMGVAIIVGSVPVAVLGLSFAGAFEFYFRGVLSVSVFLILGSGLMFLAERFSRQLGDRVDIKKGFIIGIFQSFALFPGISRSGATISGGMLLGLTREKAARFSFLLSVPATIGAGLYKLFFYYPELATFSLPAAAVGFAASFVSGLLAIGFLLRFVKKHSLYVFVIYRLVLAIVLLWLISF